MSENKFDADIFTSIIDIVNNKSLFLQIWARERETWHKLWLYGLLITNCVMIILVILMSKLSRNIKLDQYLPRPNLSNRV